MDLKLAIKDGTVASVAVISGSLGSTEDFWHSRHCFIKLSMSLRICNHYTNDLACRLQR